jgi:hypothetical protein
MKTVNKGVKANICTGHEVKYNIQIFFRHRYSYFYPNFEALSAYTSVLPVPCRSRDSTPISNMTQQFNTMNKFGAVIIHEEVPSSAMWRLVDIGLTDVSEERIVSIFRL